MFPALPAELEAKGRSVDGDVTRRQGRQAERTVRGGVLRVAHADERRLEQPDHRRQHLLPREPRAGKISRDAPPDRREFRGKQGHPRVLRYVADLRPTGTVGVLLASTAVARHSLDVAVRAEADPDVGPGRRDGERPDAAPRPEVSDRRTVGADIPEAAPGPETSEPRRSVSHVMERGRLCGERGLA